MSTCQPIVVRTSVVDYSRGTSLLLLLLWFLPELTLLRTDSNDIVPSSCINTASNRIIKSQVSDGACQVNIIMVMIDECLLTKITKVKEMIEEIREDTTISKIVRLSDTCAR